MWVESHGFKALVAITELQQRYQHIHTHIHTKGICIPNINYQAIKHLANR